MDPMVNVEHLVKRYRKSPVAAVDEFGGRMRTRSARLSDVMNGEFVSQSASTHAWRPRQRGHDAVRRSH